MALEQGRRAFLQYQGVMPPLWHERIVLAAVRTKAAHYVVLTPTLDIFVEQLSAQNRDLAAIRFAPVERGSHPG